MCHARNFVRRLSRAGNGGYVGSVRSAVRPRRGAAPDAAESPTLGRRAGDPPQYWGESGPRPQFGAGRAASRPNPSANSVGGSRKNWTAAGRMPPWHAALPRPDTPEQTHPMNLRTTIATHAVPRTPPPPPPAAVAPPPRPVPRRRRRRRRSWSTSLTGGEPAAQADAQTASMSVAQQLGIPTPSRGAVGADAVAPLEQLAASRSARDADQAAAAPAQVAAEQAERDRRAAEEAARRAAEEAAASRQPARRGGPRRRGRRAAEAAAAAQPPRAGPGPGPAAGAATAAAPSGSFQSYALQKLGGNSSQFSCLEKPVGQGERLEPQRAEPHQHRVRHPAVPELHLGRHRDRQDLGRLPADRRRPDLHREPFRFPLRRLGALAGQGLVLILAQP